ncbi:MAG: HAD-IA family hydrolase, partial [Dehalococcoidia bacterium]
YMSPSHWVTYEQAARERGIEVTAEAMAAAGVDKSWERWRTPLGVAHLDASASEAAFREVRVEIAMDRIRAAALGADEQALRAAGERAADLEGEPGRYHLYDDTRPALERLAAEDVRAIVISNHLWPLPQIVEGLGLGGLIAGVVSSARCGYRKPHPEIYRLALEQACTPAGEALMVGDNIAADVDGAESAGMYAVLLDRSGGVPAPPTPPDVRVVRSLLEVPLTWP